MFVRIAFLSIFVSSAMSLPVRAELPANVQSILEKNCTKCHGAKKKSGKLDLRTLDAMLVGGKRGAAIVEADSSASRLWQLLQPGAKPHMPPGKKKQLSEAQMTVLAEWIDQLPPDEKTAEEKTAEEKTAGETDAANSESTHAEKHAQAPPKAKNLPEDASQSLLPASAKPRTVINLWVQAGYETRDVKPNAVCSDRGFVRRVYLDLIGRIPTLDELQHFLSQTESLKRQQLIDTLIDSEEFASYWSGLFDTMLMGRNEKKLSQRKKHGWHDYLRTAFQDDKPWNDVARDVLLARAGERDDLGHLWFLYERNNNHQDIAESIAKGFFGIDIACAQCHDHPMAEEIEQAHYWGLVAFFSRSKNGKSDGRLAMEESAIGGFSSYANVFSGSTDDAVLTFLGRNEIPEVRPEDPGKQEDKDEFYVSLDKERVPRFSRREKFVDQILNDHPLVARAMVNRVWALLMGRGIVHPVESMDSKHPPSHPKLLDWLARDFAQHDYQIKRLVRAIVNSEAYQLESRRPENAEPDSFGYGLEKPLTAEAMLASLKIALRLDEQEFKGDKIEAELRRLFPDVAPENTLTNLKQSLMLSNHPAIQQALRLSAKRLSVEPINHESINSVVARVYGRSPTEDEAAAILEYYSKRQDRPLEAISQVLWALVTSAEFRFNH